MLAEIDVKGSKQVAFITEVQIFCWIAILFILELKNRFFFYS